MLHGRLASASSNKHSAPVYDISERASTFCALSQPCFLFVPPNPSNQTSPYNYALAFHLHY